jgi:hypothetical protein
VFNSVQLLQQSLHVWHFLKNRSIFRIITNYWQPQKRSTFSIWVQLLWAFGHFKLQHRFFVPKNCAILVFFAGSISSSKSTVWVTVEKNTLAKKSLKSHFGKTRVDLVPRTLVGNEPCIDWWIKFTKFGRVRLNVRKFFCSLLDRKQTPCALNISVSINVVCWVFKVAIIPPSYRAQNWHNILCCRKLDCHYSHDVQEIFFDHC